MCIICNCDQVGEQFLTHFADAQRYMQLAAEKMLECSKVATTAEARETYDSTHKQIVRLQREWNKIEHQREHGSGNQEAVDQ